MVITNLKLPDGSMQAMSHPDDWTDAQIHARAQQLYPTNNPSQWPRDSQAETKKIPKQGWSGVLHDVSKDVSNIPQDIFDFVQALPGNIYNSGKQVVTDPLRAILNIGGGARQGMEGVANIPSNFANYLKSRGIGRGNIEDAITKLHIPESNLEQSLMGDIKPGDEFLRGIGSFAPFGVVGGAERGLSGLAKRGGAAGVYGASQDQDPLVAALMGMTGEGIAKGTQRLMRPGTFLPSSPLSDEELQQAVTQAAGTNTSLGNIIENPYLKKQFENKLADVPFSGANQAMQQTAETLRQRGSNLLDELKGEYDPKDIGYTIQQALKSAEGDTRKTKEAKFKLLNDAAENAGVTTDRSNMRNVARAEFAKIKSDPDLALITDSTVKKLLENLSEERGSGDYSLRHTDFLRGDLGEKSSDAYMKDDTKLSAIYGALRNASEKDINNAIENSGNDELKALRDTAMDYYKSDWAPFQDPDILKYTRKGGDPDTLVQSFIRNSRLSDRGRLLEKLTQKLSGDQRDLLAHSYLSKNSVDKSDFNPLKLRTAFENLGDRQKEALFGHNPEMLKKLEDYTGLVGKNTDPLTLMFNAKNGSRNTSLLPWATTGGAALTSILSGNVPVGVALAALPTLLARPAVHALTSEGMRGKIVDSMIKARAKNLKNPVQKNLSPFINAVMQSAQPQKPMEIDVNQYKGVK